MQESITCIHARSLARKALQEQHPVGLSTFLFSCAFECAHRFLYPSRLQLVGFFILAQLEKRLAMLLTTAEETPRREHPVYMGIETVDLTEVPATLGALLLEVPANQTSQSVASMDCDCHDLRGSRELSPNLAPPDNR